MDIYDEESGRLLTPVQKSAAWEAAGTFWPDLSHVKALPKEEVVTRSCIRCNHPVTGDRCERCRARQTTYRP